MRVRVFMESLTKYREQDDGAMPKFRRNALARYKVLYVWPQTLLTAPLTAALIPFLMLLFAHYMAVARWGTWALLVYVPVVCALLMLAAFGIFLVAPFALF